MELRDRFLFVVLDEVFYGGFGQSGGAGLAAARGWDGGQFLVM